MRIIIEVARDGETPITGTAAREGSADRFTFCGLLELLARIEDLSAPHVTSTVPGCGDLITR